MPAILEYVLHLLTAIALVIAHYVVYTRVTPYDETALIRQGNSAAAFSLGGTLLGFSVTIASALMHNSSYLAFFGWALTAMILQVLVYVVVTRMLRMSKDQIESNNVGFGALLGAISLSIGLINAGSIS